MAVRAKAPLCECGQAVVSRRGGHRSCVDGATCATCLFLDGRGEASAALISALRVRVFATANELAAETGLTLHHVNRALYDLRAQKRVDNVIEPVLDGVLVDGHRFSGTSERAVWFLVSRKTGDKK